MDANLFANLGPALAFLGAGIAAGLGGVGSAIGSGIAGNTAAGVTTEKPELFGQILVFQALPGSQAIYGLVGAFLVLFYVGFDGLSFAQGFEVLAACIPLGLTCLYSAIYQGKVAAAGIQLLAKNPGEAGKAIILAAMVETFAIFGFLITFLVLNAIKTAMTAAA